MIRNEHSLFAAIAEVYRAKRTADLSLGLAETNADIIAELINICKKNGISLTDGVYNLLDESSIIANKIAKLNSLSAFQLLPPTNKHPSKTPDDSTEQETFQIYQNIRYQNIWSL